MSIINGANAVVGAGGAAAYEIERSLRFNSADSAYLSRTPASAGNRKTWTWSGWVKRGILTTRMELIGGYSGTAQGNLRTELNILDGASIQIASTQMQVAEDFSLVTSQVFRDPSAWYHIVLAIDTTQATSSNRVKLYVNGSQVTAFSSATYPSQNYEGAVNLNNIHYINRFYDSTNGNYYGDGYLTEIHFIDGQALDPTSFGEFNSDTGVWQPIAYTGTYGTNGFYLNFSDNSGTTSTTLGKDQAGSNNWTPNNFSVTAGAGNDSLVDTPTNYGTDTGAGGEVRGNYATLNPLKNGANATLTNGNLDITQSSTFSYGVGTIGVTSGKWYWEVTPTAAPSGYFYSVGIQPENELISSAYRYSSNGSKYPLSGAGSAYGNTYTSGDVIGVAYDGDNGNLYFYKNGTVQNSGTAAFTGLNDGTVWMPWVYMDTYPATSGCSAVINFGQRPFAYAAPSGYKSLCATNLPNPAIADGGNYFNAVLYTGNGATGQTITGVGFQPDFVWAKSRSSAYDHGLQDVLRGVTKDLNSNNTDAEETRTSSITAFTSDGFTLGGNDLIYNASGGSMVAWNWKAGGTGVSNTDGSITSTVSANTTAGFSIVTYTGTGSAATVGHGLGVAPSMVIVKRRDASAYWDVYHSSIGATGRLYLNTTDSTNTSSAPWNNTAPTSSVFTVGTATDTNNNGSAIVAYCFAPVEGYSAFGSYVGNGSADGPFIYTGFRPRYLMVKVYDSAGNSWWIWDSARNPYNETNILLAANASSADTSPYGCDFLSNGFKLRTTTGQLNGSGLNILYAAFAENPFKYALAR